MSRSVWFRGWKRSDIDDARTDAEKEDFWARWPVRGADAIGLCRYGLRSLASGDGASAIRAGWSLWTLGGLHRFASRDFITDGYDLWGYTVEATERLVFAQAAFARACAEDVPLLPGDLSPLSSEVVLPAAAIYGLLCWSGLRVIETFEQLGDDLSRRRAHRDLSMALEPCHPELLTPEAQTYFGAEDRSRRRRT